MGNAAIIAAAMSGAGGGASYDTDAAAYFARHGPQEGTPFKDAVNTCVLALKADSVWAGLDCLGVFCTGELENRVFDLKDPTGVWSFNGTTTFTAFRGVAGDGSTGWIGHPLANLAAGANYAQDLAIIGVYCNQQNGATGRLAQFGGVNASRSTILAHDAGFDFGRVNQTGDTTSIHNSTSRTGHRMAVRTGASTTPWYFNGTPQAVGAQTSNTPDAHQAAGLRNGTAYCADRLAFMYSGGAAWTDSQALAFHNALHALATALGAQY